MTTKTQLEDTFAQWFNVLCPDLPAPVRDKRFHPTRQWRADFRWPGLRVMVEIEGGVWSNGRHVRPAGYEEDCVKYNAATVMGYRVLRFTGGMLDEDPAACIEQVRALLKEAA